MKRILVALDGSPRARVVLAAAVDLAQLAQAKLVLFRAIGLPPELPFELLAMAPTDVEGALRQEARASLERLASTIPPPLVESLETDVGVPWDAIVRAGRRLNADLIVIGSHGYGGVDRLLGTTAAKVVNHTEGNVLIVRSPL